MNCPGILLIENSLEGALVSETNRRTQYETFRAMQRSMNADFRIYYERISDLDDLKRVFTWCEKQNLRKRSRTKKDGTSVEPTTISHIHISSHGNSRSLNLHNGGNNASAKDLIEAFSILKSKKVKTIMLSACDTGQNDELAIGILENTKAKGVIAYPNSAHDEDCAISEQLLYFQLIKRPEVEIDDAVRHSNDALILIGENPRRCMSCWVKRGREYFGPFPWWTKNGINIKSKERSFIPTIKNSFPKTGEISKKKKIELKAILKEI